jgi:hypothetical protein
MHCCLKAASFDDTDALLSPSLLLLESDEHTVREHAGAEDPNVLKNLRKDGLCRRSCSTEFMKQVFPMLHIPAKISIYKYMIIKYE